MGESGLHDIEALEAHRFEGNVEAYEEDKKRRLGADRLILTASSSRSSPGRKQA